jgi:predicted Na+-dependent transporter
MNGVTIRRTTDLLERSILGLVIVAAVLGWRLPGVPRLLDRHQAISIVLAILVFASALTVPAGVIQRVRALAPRLGLVVIATSVALPVLAFALSRLLSPGALRDGVLAVGVAPAEVASVAITGIAGGEVGAAAVLLVASTFICVVVAGPILALVGSHGVSSVHVLISLILVVGLPLGAGLAVKRLVAIGERVEVGAQAVAIVAVIVLVWLVSGQVRVSAAYGTLLAVLVTLILASAALGALLAWRAEPRAQASVVLTVSMRDFAVASGIAAAAFGPASAAPLGLYGVLVMAWGAVVAWASNRRRRRASSPGS